MQILERKDDVLDALGGQSTLSEDRACVPKLV